MDDIIGFAKIAIDVPHFDETQSLLANNWQPHYNKVAYQGGWDVLPLRSPGGTDSIIADLMGNAEYADTPLMQSFPLINTLTKSLQCPLMSVRLLNLKTGAVIKQHKDYDLCFEKGEARLHFPIVTNNHVEFYVNDMKVNMLPGECWYINANLPHRAANFGNTDRIHLVVDCIVNDWLKVVFDKSEKTTFKQLMDIEQTKMMITALRSHNSPTSDKLANDLELKLSDHING